MSGIPLEEEILLLLCALENKNYNMMALLFEMGLDARRVFGSTWLFFDIRDNLLKDEVFDL